MNDYCAQPGSAAPTAAGLLPDPSGHFGVYGGRFVPEALIAALDALDAAYRHAQADEAFQAEFGTPLAVTDAYRSVAPRRLVAQLDAGPPLAP